MAAHPYDGGDRRLQPDATLPTKETPEPSPTPAKTLYHQVRAIHERLAAQFVTIETTTRHRVGGTAQDARDAIELTRIGAELDALERASSS